MTVFHLFNCAILTFGPHAVYYSATPLTGDSILHRLAPLWVGARGLEFTWEYIFQGVEANANLVLNLSLAALGSLMWLRKNKPRTLIPIIYACAGVLATMPSFTRNSTSLDPVFVVVQFDLLPTELVLPT
ncbi:uncharacterized protein LOC135649835 isoform X2 [Musa acuminata AAA Group]|uniref:uncharacterized protein LOC135649835 isoform X2 n=1 Tax=Musa acuminata AAA Group TaxID=214697 RepID=UPI0031DD3ABE